MENILPFLEKYKLPLALSFLGLVLITGGIFVTGISKPKEYPKESLVEGSKTVSVDVSGAVKAAGVYKLNDGSRIEDAINAAGGFSQDSDTEYISKYINLAQKLVDGTKIYIPAVGESISASQINQVAGTNTSAKININTAAQSELESLAGVGPVTASKIISNRPYQKIEELIDKKVVGKAVFEKIKDSIVVY